MIRSLKKDDIEPVKKLGELINSNFSKIFNLEKLNFGEIVRVYVDGSIICGFIHYQKIYENIEILNIVVDPMYRRRYIASELIDDVLNGNNNVNITLEVNENNESAIFLYLSKGFRKLAIRKNYYGAENAILMGRKLDEKY